MCVQVHVYVSEIQRWHQMPRKEISYNTYIFERMYRYGEFLGSLHIYIDIDMHLHMPFGGLSTSGKNVLLEQDMYATVQAHVLFLRLGVFNFQVSKGEVEKSNKNADAPTVL